MMGSSTQRSTTTSGPSNPALNDTVTKLSQGIGGMYSPTGTTYTAPGATTQGGWASALDAAGNADYSTGIAGALSSYGKRAAGEELGVNDPLYAQQRAQLTDDVMRTTNTAFNNSGLFGSDSNQGAAARGLAGALGGLDLQQRTESYGRQAEAASMLPHLFSSGQLPSSVQTAVGGAQDADAYAQKNGGLDYMGKLSGILSGLAGASGQTQTTAQPGTPLWQTLASLAVSAL